MTYFGNTYLRLVDSRSRSATGKRTMRFLPATRAGHAAAWKIVLVEEVREGERDDYAAFANSRLTRGAIETFQNFWAEYGWELCLCDEIEVPHDAILIETRIIEEDVTIS